MATLRFNFSNAPYSLMALTKQIQPKPPKSLSLLCQPCYYNDHHRAAISASAYKVVVEHEGERTEVEVDEDESILSKALDTGLDIPHDCKLGVCMTCPAKLISGKVDQSEGMLSDDVIERGYTLLCVSYPRSDCTIRTIPEDELLSLQLATAND